MFVYGFHGKARPPTKENRICGSENCFFFSFFFIEYINTINTVIMSTNSKREEKEKKKRKATTKN